MNLKIRFVFLLLLLFLPQSYSQNEPISIEINQIYEVNLKSQQKQNFTITIKTNVEKDVNMYIEAQSPFNDPYEEPYIFIQSTKNYSQECFEESNEFTGICFIPSQQLEKGRVFTIQTYCIVDCDFKISANYNNIAQIKFDSKYDLKSYEDFGIAQVLKLVVPANEKFTDIFLLAEIQNIDEVYEGIEMYVNFGKNVTSPSPSQFQRRGDQAWGDSLGVFLSDKEIFVGDEIRVYLFLGVNTTVEFYSGSTFGNRRKIKLNVPIIDFTSRNEEKEYVLDLQNYSKIIKNYDIDILFVIYSGLPEIKVSFDESFQPKNILDNNYLSSTINYLLSPLLRKQKGYKGIIYIKIKSYFESNYAIQSGVNRKDFVELIEEVTQIVKIEKDDVQNFIYEDINVDNGKSEQIVKYKISIEMMGGGMIFANRICESLQKNNTLECLIHEKKQLLNKKVRKSFDEIPANVTKYHHTYEVFWQYDVQKCPQFTDRSLVGRKCEYQYVAFSGEKGKDTYTAITTYKMTTPITLREGIVFKDFLFRHEYNYYKFTLEKINGIVEINFFVTVIDGSVAMLMSKTQKYPELLKVDDHNVTLSQYDSIILQREQIQAGTYYIAIYSYEISDYTISVAIEREHKDPTTNQTTKNTTEIQLKTGVSQKYTLAKGKSSVNFLFTPNSDVQLDLNIVAQKGKVSYQVYDKETMQVISCPDKNECSFDINGKTPLRIVVSGDKDEVEVFTISLLERNLCLKYPVNFPLFVVLENSTECFTYNIHEDKDIEVTLSLTALDLIENTLQITAVFPQNNITIKENQKIFSSSELKDLCKGGEQTYYGKTICTFTLKLFSPSVMKFEAAVQTEDGENVLFDGVGEKVTTELSETKQKKFFYYIFQRVQLNIFLTSQTSSQYQILAKVVSSEEYLKQEKTIYPKLNEKGKNVVSHNSSDTPITYLSVPDRLIKEGDCKLCVVLISVFGISGEDTYMFKIEATQNERKLSMNSNRMETLGKNEIHEYEIETYKEKSTLLTVTQLLEEQCLKSYIRQKPGQVVQFNEYQTFEGATKTVKVILQSTSERCPYHIYYSSTQIPIIEAISSVPYPLELENQKEKYFLHYHSSNESFRVIEIVTTGDAQIAATPTDKVQIQHLLNKNIDSFLFYENNTIDDLLIDNKTQGFCSFCYYLIAVRGDPAVRQSLLILHNNSSIPLSDGATMKDRVQGGEKKEYRFYSTTEFNLNFNLLYGEVTLMVSDSDNKVIISQSLNKSKEFTVEKTQSSSTEDDFFDPSNKFNIILIGVKDSGYSLRPHISSKGAIKLTEGIPIRALLLPNKKQVFMFVSVKSSGSINILIQNLDYEEKKTEITFSVVVQGKKQQKQIIMSKIVSEGAYNLELKAIKGTYLLTIISTQTVNLNLIYAKKSWTHLQLGNTNIIKNPAIFQIYSPGDSVIIEVFDCKGEVSIEASSSYPTLISDAQSNKVSLEHSNYGGHYVVSAEKLDGQYFLQTKMMDEKEKDVMYLISYNLYSGQMPYKLYNIRSTSIESKNSKDKISFVLSPINRKYGAPNFSSITYFLYLTKSRQKLNQMIRCSLSRLFTTSQTVTSQSNKNIVFEIQKQKIFEIIGEDAQTYEIGAEAIIKLSNQTSGYISQLYYAYDSLHIVESSEPDYGDNDNLRFVLLFIVLPFLLASFLLFLAGKYCIRNFRSYPSQLLEEEDNYYGESEDQFKNSTENQNPNQQKYSIE